MKGSRSVEEGSILQETSQVLEINTQTHTQIKAAGIRCTVTSLKKKRLAGLRFGLQSDFYSVYGSKEVGKSLRPIKLAAW